MTTHKDSKTKTIKQRAIYVYLPSQQLATTWKKLADNAGSSISKFVIEHVQNSILQENEKDGFTPRIKLLEELRQLQDENKALQKRNRMLDTVVDRLEEELQTYRMKPFQEKEFTGIRQYEPQLIEIFKKRKEIRKEDLLPLLDIDSSEQEKIQAILNEVETLERYRLIKDMGGKWRWQT
jgi:uncharacterized protein YlxW (UPF0749 family)